MTCYILTCSLVCLFLFASRSIAFCSIYVPLYKIKERVTLLKVVQKINFVSRLIFPITQKLHLIHLLLLFMFFFINRKIATCQPDDLSTRRPFSQLTCQAINPSTCQPIDLIWTISKYPNYFIFVFFFCLHLS